MIPQALKRLVPRRVAPQARGLYKLGMNVVEAITGSGFGPIPPGDVARNLCWFRKNGREHLRYLVDPGGLKRSHSVLDVGCWYGRISIPLTHYLNRKGRYEGFDLDAGAVEWCRRVITPRYPGFQFRFLDIYNDVYNKQGKLLPNEYSLPYPDGEFDFVFGIALTGGLTVQEADRSLSEMARVLKPGGRCFVNWFLINPEVKEALAKHSTDIPFAPDIRALLAVEKKHPKSRYGFDEQTVRDLYEKHGLTIRDPVWYGSWCGRTYDARYRGYQDILLADSQ